MRREKSLKAEKSAFSFQFNPRGLFLPFSLALIVLLRWKFDTPWWGLAALLALLPVYYFVLPAFARRKERAFERELMRLLQQGRKSELLTLYRAQTFLRVFAPGDPLRKWLGFIYTELGDFERARACYARAARATSPAERLPVLLGLAYAKYRTGEYEGAEAVYRELIRRGQQLPEVFAGLAHTLLLGNKERGEAARLTSRAIEMSSDDTLTASLHLTRAEALLAQGKPGKARRELEAAVSALAEPADRWLEARRTWVQALLASNAGDTAEARSLLEDVVRLDEGAGLGELARRRLDELDEADDEDAEDDDERDEDGEVDAEADA
jgi:tetratricopeptide (TPR) repeat protein